MNQLSVNVKQGLVPELKYFTNQYDQKEIHKNSISRQMEARNKSVGVETKKLVNCVNPSSG